MLKGHSFRKAESHRKALGLEKSLGGRRKGIKGDNESSCLHNASYAGAKLPE